MSYFVTGATGFIGRNLVQRLLQREGTIYALVRAGSRGRLEELRTGWGADGARVVPVAGDLSQPGLGVAEEDLVDDARRDRPLLPSRGDLRHRPPTPRPRSSPTSRGPGTRSSWPGALEAGCFHQVSSIAAAGLYKGELARGHVRRGRKARQQPLLPHQARVRAAGPRGCTRPWRVYRPGIVVGDSRTGEIDKIDGPYYFFKALQRARRVLPPGCRRSGSRAARSTSSRSTSSPRRSTTSPTSPTSTAAPSTSPTPTRRRPGEVINLFARAADAPQMALRLDTDVTEPATSAVRGRLGAAAAGQAGDARRCSTSSGCPPRRSPTSTTRPTSTPADARRRWRAPGSRCRRWRPTRRGSGTTGSATSTPTCSSDRSLAGAVRGKVVLITGASSGIGRATAVKVADAGATVLLVARSIEKLEETKAEIVAAGGAAHIHRCDLVRHRGRRADGRGGARLPRPRRHPRQQRRPLDPPLGRRSPTTASTITSGRSSSTTSAPCG